MSVFSFNVAFSIGIKKGFLKEVMFKRWVGNKKV